MPNSWTKEQEYAIHALRNDLLVCAAAGSGKTSVLTERIIERIINKKEDINDFLIVTFTVAAASELKEKLIKKLREAISHNPKDAHLHRQLSMINCADISTIDSFCLNIVKENFQLIGLPAHLRIAEENELKILEKKIMTEVVEDFYKKENSCNCDAFLEAVDIFSDAKGDSVFIDSLIKIYHEFINFPMPQLRQRFFCQKLWVEYQNYTNGKICFFDTVCGNIIQAELSEKLNAALNALNRASQLCASNIKLIEKYLPAIQSDITYLSSVYEKLNCGYTSVKEKLSQYTPEKFLPLTKFEDESLKEEIKSLRDYSKNTISELKELILHNEENIFLLIKKSTQINSALCDIIEEFSSRFKKEKLDEGIMSFSDSAHYAFQILVEDFSYETMSFKKSVRADEISQKFKEIFIDEYQDINLLQDIIFSSISNGKNRFMVGDIKQSIYAFRGASPEIFKSYRENFENYSENDQGRSVKIFLKNNFRCDTSIIDLTNFVFTKLMNIKNKSDYTNEDMLVYSKPLQNDLKLKSEVTLFDDSENDSDTDTEYIYIADRIISMINKGEVIIDGRQASFKDIAILTRDYKELNKIKQVLDAFGIPADSGSGEDILDSVEVISTLAFLKAIDNPSDDISLVCLLTSPIFAFSSAELLEIRDRSKKSLFYFAVKNYNKNNDLKIKINNFLSIFDELRQKSLDLTADKLLWYIYNKISLLEILCKDKPEKRRKNLLCLHEYARNFGKHSSKDLSSFIEYMIQIKENKGGPRSGVSNGDFVRLTTIHKSKGLEFPICFVAGLGKSFNTSDLKERMIFSDSLGRVFYLKDESGFVRLNNPLRRAGIIEKNKKSIDEELRLLYVAMTRAKHKLILTGTVQYKKSMLEKYNIATSSKALLEEFISNSSSYLEMIIYALSNCEVFSTAFERYSKSNSNEKSSSDTLCVNIIKDFEAIQNLDHEITQTNEKSSVCKLDSDIISKLVNFSYFNEAACKLPCKLSVSELRVGLLDEAKEPETTALKEAPEFLSEIEISLPAQKGTAMHTFMQFADFDNCVKFGTQKEAERLADEEFLTPVQAALLEHSKLMRFFDSQLFKEISKSQKCYREKRFNLKLPAEYFLKDTSKIKDKDLSILIQGVIDCFYKTEDGYVIVDFKTDRVPKGEEGAQILRERHGEQMKYYKLAVEKITGEKVSKLLIYSFAQNREIEL